LPTGDVTNTKVACVECDLLVDIPPLKFRQRSLCPRCGHVLSYGNLGRARHALPYGICAAVMLPLSLLFPFMSFARSGIENEVNLVQTAWTLYLDGSVFLSGLIFFFIITLPACVVAAILLIAFALNFNRNLPLLRPAARFIFSVGNWSMVEVFIIGVLVSLVKIAHMASVELGLSLWTYMAFAIFTVAALAKLDKLVVWQQIEKLST
jgi:paraquat-inducible protein A